MTFQKFKSFLKESDNDMRQRRRMRRAGMGPGGICYCPNCGYEKERSVPGVRCLDTNCPKCGTALIRRGR